MSHRLNQLIPALFKKTIRISLHFNLLLSYFIFYYSCNFLNHIIYVNFYLIIQFYGHVFISYTR